MDHNEKHDSPEERTAFRYTYSAKEQAELKRIREKYLTDTTPDEPDAMEQIRRLDAGVHRKATVISLSLGIICTLILGLGMSLVMTDIGESLAIAKPLIPGILIGLAGMIGVILAYPLYQHILQKERRKVAPEILRLSEELLK